MNEKLDGISIADCAVCRDIPQKNSCSSLRDGPWPITARQLVTITASLQKCPYCGTFYAYDEDFDPGEPMVMAETTWSLVRLTPHLARRLLSAKDESEQDRLALQRELAEFEARGPAMIHDCRSALAREGLNWHIKKFLVEVLTDHFMAEQDWDAIRTVLLEHPDPVVRVETASDLIYVATEEYAVWTIRYFSREQQAQARQPSQEQSQVAARTIAVLVDGLDRQDPAMRLDTTLGYCETVIGNTAYWGLSNAVFRGMDVTAAVPALVGWLFGDDNKWKQEHAADDLKKYMGADPARAQLVLDELDRRGKSKLKWVQATRRHCRACLKQAKEAK